MFNINLVTFFVEKLTLHRNLVNKFKWKAIFPTENVTELVMALLQYGLLLISFVRFMAEKVGWMAVSKIRSNPSIEYKNQILLVIANSAKPYYKSAMGLVLNFLCMVFTRCCYLYLPSSLYNHWCIASQWTNMHCEKKLLPLVYCHLIVFVFWCLI